MAELGLNVFQVIQNELLSREGTRSTLGIGFRLAIIEERLKNHDAKTKNGLVWKPLHTLSPISALTPEAREASETQRRRLLERKGAHPFKDDKDPTMLIRDDEQWLVHRDFPRTVLEFKELQFHRMYTTPPSSNLQLSNLYMRQLSGFGVFSSSMTSKYIGQTWN